MGDYRHVKYFFPTVKKKKSGLLSREAIAL